MNQYDRELEELEQKLNGALTAPKKRRPVAKKRKDSGGSLLDYLKSDD
jgi:hypothetical protein